MSDRFALVTLTTPLFQPMGRNLFGSLRRFHPGARCLALMLDRRPREPIRESAFDVIYADELGVPAFDQRMFANSRLERLSSLKAWLMAEALRRYPDVDRVFFSDADVMFFSGLDEVQAELDNHSALLVPHFLSPDWRQRCAEHRLAMRFGVFNGGFMGVRRCPDGLDFLDWWDHKLNQDCHANTSEGLFCDQSWLELAAAFIPSVGVCRHPGINVAYWNYHERPLERTAQGYATLGRPLVLFHYSGHRPLQPHRLTKYATFRPIPVEPGSVLAELLAAYQQGLRRHGQSDAGSDFGALDRYFDGRLVPAVESLYYSDILQQRMQANFNPYAGLPRSLQLGWLRLLARVAQALGFRDNALREFPLYRYYLKWLYRRGNLAETFERSDWRAPSEVLGLREPRA